MRYSLIVVLILSFLCVPISQAQHARWQDLSTIRPGTKVDVVDQHLRKQSGKFVGFSDTEVTLQSEGKTVAIARDEVYRVTVAGRRKRNTLIGMATGGAIGLGLGAAAVIAYRGDLSEATALGTAVFGAGIGAGIGAVVPPNSTVYQSEPLKGDRSQPTSDLKADAGQNETTRQ